MVEKLLNIVLSVRRKLLNIKILFDIFNKIILYIGMFKYSIILGGLKILLLFFKDYYLL